MKLIQYLKEPTWIELLKDEFNTSYFKKLEDTLTNNYTKKTVYPPVEDIFTALNLTPFSKLKAIIIGQDPYHRPNQANGLSFSVKSGERIPPSLVNIFKELNSDLNIKPPSSGNLEGWAKQGVLLLNNQLTVLEGQPMSHKDIGWNEFTDKIIELVNDKKENIVFILWGSPAHKKAKAVDTKKHFVIKSVHPSPLSSYRGFFGSKPFSQANKFLESKNLNPIDWKLV